jgi:hypothetical protein
MGRKFMYMKNWMPFGKAGSVSGASSRRIRPITSASRLCFCVLRRIRGGDNGEGPIDRKNKERNGDGELGELVQEVSVSFERDIRNCPGPHSWKEYVGAEKWAPSFS